MRVLKEESGYDSQTLVNVVCLLNQIAKPTWVKSVFFFNRVNELAMGAITNLVAFDVYKDSPKDNTRKKLQIKKVSRQYEITSIM